MKMTVACAMTVLFSSIAWPQTSALPAAAMRPQDEISTRDEPISFRAQTNLVEVPVIVRDRDGHAVGNLQQDSFRVFDKGKRQEIIKFAVQAATAAAGRQSPHPAAPSAKNIAAVFPDHFVAFLFDDLHIQFEDLPQVRAAAMKYIRMSLQPQDRVAVYTTSGHTAVDFTDRPAQLSEALARITPRPIRAAGIAGFGGCGGAFVSYFQAVQVDQQVGLEPFPSDADRCLALRVAVEEYADFHTAVEEIRDAYTSGLQESRAVLSALKIIVQRMGAAPGQRSLVLVSPGFFVPPQLSNQNSDLMALAVRSKVVISTVGARGVWTIPQFDACQKGAPAAAISDEITFRTLDSEAATDELIALAEGTGGAVNLDNDFAGGVRRAAATPEYLYLLSFVPQNLKTDGRFHALKVTLKDGEHLTVQARRGYWAPNDASDEVVELKQEIDDALFSRQEMHNLPVEMQTQVKGTGAESELTVLASVDLKLLHLRKAEDRHRDDVTIIAAVFDSNGNFVAGTQKVLQLRLRAETVEGLPQRPPMTIDTNFRVKPGTYLVRLVARDTESQQITAENAGVQVE